MSDSLVKLHILALDVPDPPDYGGAIDIFYKIKHLSQQGVAIYLHCFQYGREASENLNQWCAAVYYYPRKTGLRGLHPTIPYMIHSRRSKTLLNRLIEIDAPILFDGLHVCTYLNHPALANRVKILRNQNVEQDYFIQLAKRTNHPFKKLYYIIESRLLKRFEARLNSVDAFATVSMADQSFFQKLYPNIISAYIPSFHPYDSVVSVESDWVDYCLYHGNLAHEENIEAALFLIEKVFSKINIQLVIAGRKPSPKIIEAAKGMANIRIVDSPTSDELDILIQQAQIHVLPTFQATGLKLKLLLALFAGKHVLVNPPMLVGTGLNELCAIATDAASFLLQINQLMQQKFTNIEIEKRKHILAQHYSNEHNAKQLIKLIQQS
jgi:hypothetical protein